MLSIIRCNSLGPPYTLYPLAAPSLSCALVAVAPAPTTIWHRRLGHPCHEALSKLSSSSGPSHVPVVLVTLYVMVN